MCGRASLIGLPGKTRQSRVTTVASFWRLPTFLNLREVPTLPRRPPCGCARGEPLAPPAPPPPPRCRRRRRRQPRRGLGAGLSPARRNPTASCAPERRGGLRAAGGLVPRGAATGAAPVTAAGAHVQHVWGGQPRPAQRCLQPCRPAAPGCPWRLDGQLPGAAMGAAEQPRGTVD